jgi:hypothetical protein
MCFRCALLPEVLWTGMKPAVRFTTVDASQPFPGIEVTAAIESWTRSTEPVRSLNDLSACHVRHDHAAVPHNLGIFGVPDCFQALVTTISVGTETADYVVLLPDDRSSEGVPCRRRDA